MFLRVIIVEGLRTRKKRMSEFKCDQCGKVYTKRYCINTISKEFHFCSHACSNIAQRKFGKIEKKKRETCLKKYGVEHVLQSSTVKEKSKETCLKKYGVDNPFKSSKIKEKIELTFMKKYGVSRPLKSEKCKIKSKETCLKKYGAEYIFQTDQFKEQSRKTLLKKFGVDHPMKLNSIKKRFSDPSLTHKRHETMKKNGTYGKSKIEDKFYEFLCVKFGDENVMRQIEINTWNIDFYVKPIDVYIQLDGVYWHGLDRPIEVIKKFKNPRDRNIYETWLRDKEQNEWFWKNRKSLIRVTDVEFRKTIANGKK